MKADRAVDVKKQSVDSEKSQRTQKSQPGVREHITGDAKPPQDGTFPQQGPCQSVTAFNVLSKGFKPRQLRVWVGFHWGDTAPAPLSAYTDMKSGLVHYKSDYLFLWARDSKLFPLVTFQIALWV